MTSQRLAINRSSMQDVNCIVCSAEVESRPQGSRPRPRPRTQKKSEAKAKDSLSEDRHSRGQGQECSRPRPRTKDTSASVLQKKKKKVSTKIFQAISTKKNVFQKIFQALHKILTIKKILLSSSRGQANFRGLEASRPRPRTSKCVLEDVLEDSTSGARSRSILVCKKSTARRPAMRGLSTGLDRKNSSPTLRKAAQAMLG